MKEENDENIRKEFAKAFGWYKRKGMYDYGEPEPRTPTWSEIFIELGKLMAKQKAIKEEILK